LFDFVLVVIVVNEVVHQLVEIDVEVVVVDHVHHIHVHLYREGK
jgi:hypothetical protein